MRAFLILLTTLFLSVMPLKAAYADDKQTCVTVSDVLSDENKATITKNQGKFLALDEAQTAKFVSNATKLFGNDPPYEIKGIVLVFPNGNPDVFVNVGYFGDGGCLIGVARLPAELVIRLVSDPS